MAGKYKVLQMSKGDLTKERQEAKLHAELMAKMAFKLQVTPPNHLDPVANKNTSESSNLWGPYHLEISIAPSWKTIVHGIRFTKTHRST